MKLFAALVITIGLFGAMPVANAYSISQSSSSSLDFQDFNLASGFSQLFEPFQSFMASVQSDTLIITANPGQLIPSSATLPSIDGSTSADVQNYFGQLGGWFNDAATWIRATFNV